MAQSGSFLSIFIGRATARSPTLGISTESAMHSNDADKGDDAGRQPARKPELGLLRGGGDERTTESALAREFAHRALAPLVSDLRGRHGLLDGRKVAGAIGLTPQQFAD